MYQGSAMLLVKRSYIQQYRRTIARLSCPGDKGLPLVLRSPILLLVRTSLARRAAKMLEAPVFLCQSTRSNKIYGRVAGQP